MRELFRKYWKLIVLGFVLIFSLSYYSSHLRHKESHSSIERQLLSIVSPLQQSVQLATDGFSAIWAKVFGSSIDTTTRLTNENAQLKEKLVEHEELRLENDRLKKLLSFSAQQPDRMVAARVIGVDATSWFRSITIDRGTSEELREGMAVISANGVVGKIVTCTPHSSRVLLVIDASSKLSTLIERTRARAISSGNGNGMSLDYLPLTDDVQIGDLLVTSGLSNGFPKGLIVGAVTTVDKRGFDMFQSVKIEPAVDFDHLEEVLVILNAGAAPAFNAGKP